MQNTSVNKKSGGHKKPDGGKKRSRTTVLLLLSLLLLLLLLIVGLRAACSDTAGVIDTSPDTSSSTDSLDISTDDSLSIDTLSADSIGLDHSKITPEDSLARALARARRDSLAQLRADSVAVADSLAKIAADSIALADSLAKIIADSIALADSLSRAHADSLARIADSLAMLAEIARADSLAKVIDPCARDTLKPWVYPDPSGGLHRKAVSIKLIANKKCNVEWSFDGVDHWKVYDGKNIAISKDATLYYRAADSCGKKMDVRSKRYEFDLSIKTLPCPDGMEYVKAGGKEFCIDVYEWPNRKGIKPQSFVSMFHAMDSCFSARKRLCTSDEWTAACAGPEKWSYLYGDVYESNACVTRDTSIQKSGSRPECRGYYAVFDMGGNLAEWTSTPSPQNRSFNNVMGGYWESGNQSRCADARYSYFPQNRHNPVGFRCCSDVKPSPQGGGR